MMNLRNRCLMVTPMAERDVQGIYDAAFDANRERLIAMVRSLAMSHERLRAELQGAEILLRENGVLQQPHIPERARSHGATERVGGE